MIKKSPTLTRELKMNKTAVRRILLVVMILSLAVVSNGATRYKWITIGALQNFFYDTGSEYEVVTVYQQQWGYTWDSFYRDQDMQAAKGMWIGAKNFFDPVMNREYPHKIAHNGQRAVTDIEIREYMPQEIKLLARNNHPEIYVDENEASDMMNGADGKNDDIDEIVPSLTADRVVVNQVNTSVGISFTRKIYAVSQQEYDDILISEYEFENTGIYDQDGNVYTQDLEGVYFHWQWRDAISQEGCYSGSWTPAHRHWISNSVRDVSWGYSMMYDVIGEDQDNPNTTSPYEDMTGLDAQDKDGNWMRGYISWMGKWSDFGYDNIGSPNVVGIAHNGLPALNDGRLGSAQYKGMVVIHADTSPSNNADDQSQPRSNAYLNSNHAYTRTAGLDQYDANSMTEKYTSYMSNGDMGSFAEKVWETTNGDAGTYSSNTSAAGFSQMLAFGPYTMAPGEKIKIVWAECAAGLGHDYGYEIGRKWMRARNGETLTVVDPANPSATITINADNCDAWKDAMVYSGRDSLMKTFSKAIELYKGGFYNTIPQAPLPPSTVEIFSTVDGVKITWDGSSSLAHNHFEGFRIYRAFIEKDSTYRVILDCNISDGDLDAYRIDGSDLFEYVDSEPLRGQNYYYYITAYDDGTQNLLNPGKELESSPFYTRTNRGATVKSPPAPNEKINIDDYDLDNPDDRKALMDFIFKIVPNPINVRNEQIQFVGNVNKLLFAGVPNGCTIKIFTERGDFVTDVAESEEGYAWYLTTEWQQVLVSGIYIAYFIMDEDYQDDKTGVRFDKGDTIVKKFIVIR
jgi:hypothetical protein